ncbi:glycosyltransferase family 4 protein [Solitalea koreensis]|uniref:Glycosyltransferase involved in cell wall bisynthesis n=1 Tax=Solitalea koreensis TaxID=543615 RepID=A0A521AN10_9SPHI|nr:glycosyltransferase family 4 protein [Solitalea koreensis]SMO36185.1 Glycosyltransferase involved in cell wall bisynthesis [Solitalea koreensis]
MKIVYFYQYFCTPKGSWSTRVYDFAKYWISQGHEVTVVTSIYSKSDLKATRFIEDQNIEGIHVKVINIDIDNKQSLPKRILTFIQYTLVSSWYALTLPADVVIASSGPISVGFTGLLARHIRNKKMVFEVRDIWPDALIELGVFNNKIAQKVAYALERACYRSADLIVALSPGMKANIERRFNLDTVISVTNGANLDLFATPANTSKLPAIFRENKVAIYTGNIGKTNNSELLYSASQILKAKNNKSIKIVLVGDGQLKTELKNRAQQEGLDNFVILDLMPKIELVALLQNALVSLIPLASAPLLDTSSPNKLFESLAAGVPVVQTTQGWIKDFLDQNNCGFTVKPDNPEELADLLIYLDENQSVLNQQGTNALNTAQLFFGKDYLAKKMLNGLMGIASHKEKLVTVK